MLCSGRSLTVPPFHPSRILNESCFRLNPDSGSYDRAEAKPLHIEQASVENLRRFIADISSSGLFVWYSNVAEDADRASLMIYAVEADAASGWYAGFTRKDDWRLAQVKGAPRGAVAALLLPLNQTPNVSVAPAEIAEL